MYGAEEIHGEPQKPEEVPVLPPMHLLRFARNTWPAVSDEAEARMAGMDGTEPGSDIIGRDEPTAQTFRGGVGESPETEAWLEEQVENMRDRYPHNARIQSNEQ